MQPDIPIAPMIKLSGVFVGALSGGLAAINNRGSTSSAFSCSPGPPASAGACCETC